MPVLLISTLDTPRFCRRRVRMLCLPWDALDWYGPAGCRTEFLHRLTDLETAAPEKEPLECGRTKRVLRPVRKSSQGSYNSVKDEKTTMVHWHGWQILLIDNSCKQKAQLRLMKIEIARCNLAGGEKSFVGVVWPQFDHNRNETSWHQTKQNEKTNLKIGDIAYSMCRFTQCVREWSTMGFKRPWVRFSPLGPNRNDPNLFPIGDGFGLFVF